MNVTNSESPNVVSYSSVIVKFCLSSTVSVLLSFEYEPEMMSSPFRSQDDRMLKMADSERATRISYRIVLNFFCYLSAFSSYSTFYFTMENPYLGGKFWGFSDPNYPKVVN